MEDYVVMNVKELEEIRALCEVLIKDKLSKQLYKLMHRTPQFVDWDDGKKLRASLFFAEVLDFKTALTIKAEELLALEHLLDARTMREKVEIEDAEKSEDN